MSATEGGQAGEVFVGGESSLRAAVARGNYLGQVRVDMPLADKEISKRASKLEEQDWMSAKI